MQKIRFFNSGLYSKSFYQTYDTEEILFDDWDFRQHCHYNKELMKTRYSEVELLNLEENEIDKLIDDDFFKDINDHFILYEPLIFNENIALDCGLIPFIYHGDNKYELLALGNSGFDPSIKTNLLFKLDAYQVLSDNSIDEHSPFFGTYSKDVAKRVLGDGVYNRVIASINGDLVSREIDNLDIRIGDNLRSAREFNKLTQTEVGYILNVSPQQIAKYETGKNRISASNLYRLAKMLL